MLANIGAMSVSSASRVGEVLDELVDEAVDEAVEESLVRWIIQFFWGSLFGPCSPVLNRANRRTPPSPPSLAPWRTAMTSLPSFHFSSS